MLSLWLTDCCSRSKALSNEFEEYPIVKILEAMGNHGTIDIMGNKPGKSKYGMQRYLSTPFSTRLSHQVRGARQAENPTRLTVWLS